MKGEPDDYRVLYLVGIICAAIVLLAVVASEMVLALKGVPCR